MHTSSCPGSQSTQIGIFTDIVGNVLDHPVRDPFGYNKKSRVIR